MVIDMLVFVDLKSLQNHLLILQRELQESLIIIDMLNSVSTAPEESFIIRNQLSCMERERRNILRRMDILEHAIARFKKVKIEMDMSMRESMHILDRHRFE